MPKGERVIRVSERDKDKKGNIVLMTSGGEEQFNRANEGAVISSLALRDTGAQAALSWFLCDHTLPWVLNLPPFSLATPFLAGASVSSSSISCSSLSQKHTHGNIHSN